MSNNSSGESRFADLPINDFELDLVNEAYLMLNYKSEYAIIDIRCGDL